MIANDDREYFVITMEKTFINLSGVVVVAQGPWFDEKKKSKIFIYVIGTYRQLGK